MKLIDLFETMDSRFKISPHWIMKMNSNKVLVYSSIGIIDDIEILMNIHIKVLNVGISYATIGFLVKSEDEWIDDYGTITSLNHVTLIGCISNAVIDKLKELVNDSSLLKAFVIISKSKLSSNRELSKKTVIDKRQSLYLKLANKLKDSVLSNLIVFNKIIHQGQLGIIVICDYRTANFCQDIVKQVSKIPYDQLVSP